MNKPSLIRLCARPLAALFALLLIILPNGCGGGTGGSGLRVEGRIVNQENAALEDVEVTILETGDSATTDSEGFFAVEVSGETDTLTFEFRKDELVVQTPLDREAPKEGTLVVRVQVDEPKKEATVEVVSTPTPAPTAPPQATVPPTPTRVSDSEPTAMPTPETPAPATPTPLPTSTPVIEPSPTAVIPSTPTFTPTPRSYSACDVDIDQNGSVNINDAVAAQNAYAAGNFDFNRDGTTSAADLSAFQAAFEQYQGQSCAPPN